MPNHWHFVLRPNCDGEIGEFLPGSRSRTRCYHAHYDTAGQGHDYQGRFKGFPIQDDGHFLTVDNVNAAMSEAELEAVRRSIQRGSPLGDETGTVTTAQRLGIISTLCPRGRPRARPEPVPNKEI